MREAAVSRTFPPSVDLLVNTSTGISLPDILERPGKSDLDSPALVYEISFRRAEDATRKERNGEEEGRADLEACNPVFNEDPILSPDMLGRLI